MPNLCNDLQAEKVIGLLLSGPALNPQYIALSGTGSPSGTSFMQFVSYFFVKMKHFFQLSFKSSELVLLLYIIVVLSVPFSKTSYVHKVLVCSSHLQKCFSWSLWLHEK